MKRYVQALLNTSIPYEASILADATLFHIEELKTDYSPMCTPGLVPLTRLATTELLSFVHECRPGAVVYTARTARYKPWMLVPLNDVILLNTAHGIIASRVFFNCSVDGVLMCCVHTWQ